MRSATGSRNAPPPACRIEHPSGAPIDARLTRHVEETLGEGRWRVVGAPRAAHIRRQQSGVGRAQLVAGFFERQHGSRPPQRLRQLRRRHVQRIGQRYGERRHIERPPASVARGEHVRANRLCREQPGGRLTPPGTTCSLQARAITRPVCRLAGASWRRRLASPPRRTPSGIERKLADFMGEVLLSFGWNVTDLLPARTCRGGKF